MKKIFTGIAVFLFVSLPVIASFKDLPKAIDKADASCVLIKLDDAEKTPIGSGVSIVRGKDFYVWTDAHVAGVAKNEDGTFNNLRIHKKIIKDGEEASSLEVFGEVIAYDETIDIALLKLSDGSSKYFGNTRFYLEDKVLPRGTDVLCLGNFLGFRGVIPGFTGAAPATIGGYGHVIDGQKFDILHNGSVIGGCSGSGVFLEDGRCIGLVCRMYATNQVLYSPIREIKKWAVKNDLLWALDDKVKKKD